MGKSQTKQTTAKTTSEATCPEVSTKKLRKVYLVDEAIQGIKDASFLRLNRRSGITHETKTAKGGSRAASVRPKETSVADLQRARLREYATLLHRDAALFAKASRRVTIDEEDLVKASELQTHQPSGILLIS